MNLDFTAAKTIPVTTPSPHILRAAHVVYAEFILIGRFSLTLILERNREILNVN